ncbi:MAG: DoxX family protein [Castellaniella sp.]|uniref:DoxX family protein n=1 Tax=Castellaniella sp. TaxID=1955812 RepID=UPI0011F99B94|nr:DoxX family protein [Castellaniella sp.]TAN25608.1 MAG: DoxX family protein [Castellaniella sp.]
MKSATLIVAMNGCHARLAQWLGRWIGPMALLLMRLWVADAFWRAGVVKFADPEGTRVLFENLYHVPVLTPGIAAVLGTWIELIAPWLLGLGIASRLTALFLFAYNLIAVISYPDLWPHGFWIGLVNLGDFADHKVWAMMLLAVMSWGAGTWSVDGIVRRVRRSDF